MVVISGIVINLRFQIEDQSLPAFVEKDISNILIFIRHGRYFAPMNYLSDVDKVSISTIVHLDIPIVAQEVFGIDYGFGQFLHDKRKRNPSVVKIIVFNGRLIRYVVQNLYVILGVRPVQSLNSVVVRIIKVNLNK